MDIGLERILQEVVGLRKDYRELLVSFRRLRPVHDWWLKQHEDRTRQTRSRVKKRGQEAQRYAEHCRHTLKNDARHSLTRSVASVAGSSPTGKVMDGMRACLSRYTMDMKSWIRTQAGLHPHKALAYLVSLYNGAYWVPWVQPYGDGKMKVFTGWEDDTGKPTYTFAAKGDVVVKTSPPVKWETPSIIKFSDAHMWKVFTVIHTFLWSVDPDLTGPDFEVFRDHMDVMCQFSSYKVLGDTEWAPTFLTTWEPSAALRAFRKVAPRVTALRTAFLEGISTPFESIVSM